MNTVHWNVIVPAELDKRLRVFLAIQGGRKGDLSRFITEAVSARIDTLAKEVPASGGAYIEPEAAGKRETKREAQ